MGLLNTTQQATYKEQLKLIKKRITQQSPRPQNMAGY